MNLVRRARLHFQSGRSDKVYEVDLCEQPGADPDSAYVVNFRYGRTGATLREGTKTTSPVSLERATSIFESLVLSKSNKGYVEIGGSGDSVATQSSAVTPATAPEDVKQAVLAALRVPPQHWSLSRIVWRAGELEIEEAAPIIQGFVGQGDVILDYSIAWALGRCGGQDCVPTIERLLQHSDEKVQRIAAEAMLHVSEGERRATWLREQIERLPEELRTDIEREDEDGVRDRLEALARDGGNLPDGLLETAYLLASDSAVCQRALAHVVASAPFEQGTFRALRHIFKMAELRFDPEIYGLFALRFERTRPGAWRQPFQSPTRNYLRRRVWRTLQRLGEADNDRFVDMALGVLLPLTDEHGDGTRAEQQWSWTRESGNQSTTVHYGPYSRFWTINRLLHANSRQHRAPSGMGSWKQIRTEPDEARSEAFPTIWDRHPEALVLLLQRSRCELVHEFAVRALAANEDYVQDMAVEVLAELLQAPYEVTSRFALEQVRTRYDPGNPDLTLVAACATSGLEAARTLAKGWISDSPAMLGSSPDLIAALIANPFEEMRGWAREQLTSVSFSTEGQSEVVTRVLANFGEFSLELAVAAVADVSALLIDLFPDAVRIIEFSVLEELLGNDAYPVRLLGARLLVANNLPVGDIPGPLFDSILNSEDDEIRGAGVSLLGKFSDAELLQRRDQLIGFCLSRIQPVRTAVRPLVSRLARSQRDFAAEVLQALVAALFRTEATEGYHADLVALAEESLSESLTGLDRGLVWRLLQAQSKGAQALGVVASSHVRTNEFTMRQWARLGHHSALSVRERSWSIYRDDVWRVREFAEDALRLLNGEWEDTRTFAVDFFREHFTGEDWSPELIIGICDNTRDDIQRFGRELITNFFEDGHGVEYLTKLSQHPSTNVQLFTTNYLVAYASNDLARIRLLEPFFLTVLSNVNRGRIAKDRVLNFLLTEAMRSHPEAVFVGSIFCRQSVVIALGDKARFIEGMRDIRNRYPDIELPISVRSLPIKGHRTEEVSDAV